jgi:L-aminopeptidase/D-esterase-like protein
MSQDGVVRDFENTELKDGDIVLALVSGNMIRG